MAGDYTRFTFGPQRDYSGVFKQQGRVDLDADFNELIEIVDRRWRSETIDIIGHCIVPNTTPDAFLVIPASMGDFDIGIGRMYVDGIQVENHGRPPLDYQVDLGEMRGTTLIPYSDQPYLPLLLPPPALASVPGTTDLVYIDVWQREVTALEDPSLREIALGGPDTTTRTQSVWQVRALQNVGRHGCDDDIPEWNQLVAPSAGRLTTSAVPPPSSDDPCIISPSGGYRGLENRLYRVEIHSIGPIGGGAPAKFKWSRNNATIASSVSAIPSSTEIIVQQIGRDQVLRFRIGDWIEITDDFREFQGLAGHMAQITDIDEANRVITFNPAIPGVINFDAADPTRHTRVCRWDQTQNVDANGLLDIAAGPIDIEDGIRVTFNLDPAGGSFKIGDYWVFAARTADGSIDILQNAPPRGILHHFCRLGFIHWGTPSTFTDCRTFWPPPIPEGGDNCACTVCVTPQAHASGQLTVQMAIDQVIAAGGGTVCLEVGNYSLQTPVQIQGAQSVKLVGKGIASRLVAINATGTVVVNKSQDIVLDAFSILCRGSINSPQEAVRVVASRLVRIEHLAIRVESEDPSWAAIGLADALMTLNVSENVVQAPIGIRSGSDPTGAGSAGLADVHIEKNEFDCTATAVAFAPVTVHQLLNRICSNRINGCIQGGLLLNGVTAPDFGLEVQANVFSVLGHGIVARLNGLRVLDNDLLQPKGTDPKQQCGVFLTPALTDNIPITDCHILGNRIHGFDRAGIFVNAALRTAMIKQNQIARVGIGLLLEPGQVMDQVSIENNQFNDIHRIAIMGKGEDVNYAATGNQIRTRSSEPAVILEFTLGEGIFSHNECYREGGGAAPDVLLQANTLIVGNNRVVGGGISLDIRTARLHYTVIGNICRGRIMVEFGNGITSPWAPLNLEGVV